MGWRFEINSSIKNCKMKLNNIILLVYILALLFGATYMTNIGYEMKLHELQYVNDLASNYYLVAGFFLLVAGFFTAIFVSNLKQEIK